MTSPGDGDAREGQVAGRSARSDAGTWPVAGPAEVRRLPPPEEVGRSELRSFGWTLAAGFGFVAAVLLWRGHEGPAAVPALAAAVLVAAALAEPERLSGLRRRWMGAAGSLSRVTNGILLTAVFYLVASPMGLVARWLGWDPMDRNPPSGEGTCWKERDEPGDGERYHRPY